jgi:hypothetical protein
MFPMKALAGSVPAAWPGQSTASAVRLMRLMAAAATLPVALLARSVSAVWPGQSASLTASAMRLMATSTMLPVELGSASAMWQASLMAASAMVPMEALARSVSAVWPGQSAPLTASVLRLAAAVRLALLARLMASAAVRCWQTHLAFAALSSPDRIALRR